MTILVQCIRMEINLHFLGGSDTYIVVILLEAAVFLAPLTCRQENSVSNSITTIYVSEAPKQCTFIPLV